MICKECGAYNPDHATYCKVCAANLKGEPEAEVTETPVAEDPQPTKRFSRPSWVVPEQEKKEEPAAKVEEEAAEEIEDDEDFDEEPVEAPVEKPVRKSRRSKPAEDDELDDYDDDPDAYEQPSKEPAWGVPSRAAKRAKPADEEDEEEENGEEDGIYHDEEALDQDDDSFEYEPTPPKRKNTKKKGNTLFTVLLIAIIVVIACILIGGGLFLLNKTGILKCSGTKTATTNTELPVASATANPNETPEAQPDEKEATLLEYVDDSGKDYVAITVLVPAHGTMTIDFPHQDDYQATNDKDVAYPRRVNIPVEIFYPNEPLDEPTVTIQPKITVTTQVGSSYEVACPSFTKNFSPLTINLTSPTAKDDGSYMASEGNVVHIEGKVDDFDVTLTINGVATNVYEGGVFMQDYNLTGSAAETIELVATKNNYVTASTSFTVDPYVFVPDPMVLEVKDDIASLKADKNGKLTVTGTTLPGATLTATSDDTTRVLCGTVTVDAEGKFSFGVTMDSSFYGISTITLTGTKIYQNGSQDVEVKDSKTFIVSRSYKDKDAFIKAYSKKYKEVNNHITMQEILADLETYAGNDYGFRIIATVNEIITEGDKTFVKMTIAKTNEIVYVRNMSTKWAPQDNIGGKYRIYGNLVGTYGDTGCAEFIAWFVYNSK